MALQKIGRLALVNYALECGYVQTSGIFNIKTVGPSAEEMVHVHTMSCHVMSCHV